MATITGGKRGEGLYGTSESDTIYGNGGNDFIYGYSGDDALHGGAGADSIQGHQGNDQLFGDAGRDKLYGQQGHDSLDGGADNDWLGGGTGGDSLRGGGGADLFFYSRAVDSTSRTTAEVQALTGDPDDVAGIDNILDFSPAEGDRIDISRIDGIDPSRDGFDDNNPITLVSGPSSTPGTAWIIHDPAQTGHATLFINQDSDSDAEFQLEIYGTFTTLRWGVDIIA